MEIYFYISALILDRCYQKRSTKTLFFKKEICSDLILGAQIENPHGAFSLGEVHFISTGKKKKTEDERKINPATSAKTVLQKTEKLEVSKLAR